MQSSSVFDFAVEDINNDGFKDLLIVGNNYDISTQLGSCLLYTSPSPRDRTRSRMPSSA